jgi:hypothetical protein
MKRDEIAMGAAASEMVGREPEPVEPVGALSPAEAAPSPVTPAWVEHEELFAYGALDRAIALHREIDRMLPSTQPGEYHDAQRRLADARETARIHLSNLHLAGKIRDALLIHMAEREGVLWT